MSDDLIDMLRQRSPIYGTRRVMDEAADELARLRAEVERLTAALHDAVKALEMVTDQNAIKSTTVANAFAACVQAASIGRKALSDQNPIKNRARRQG